MNSLSHSENFACFAAPCRLVSCPQASRGFPRLLTVLQHVKTAPLRGSLPIHTNSLQPPPSSAHIQSP
jgi:hypothetical protein